MFIQPIRSHDWETKILAYANDLAVVTTDPREALREINEEAE